MHPVSLSLNNMEMQKDSKFKIKQEYRYIFQKVHATFSVNYPFWFF